MRDSNFLKAHNAKTQWHPMAHPAEMQATPPRIIHRPEAVTLTDIDGHKVINTVGGPWNDTFGYSRDPVIEAIARQLAELPFYSGFGAHRTGHLR